MKITPEFSAAMKHHKQMNDIYGPDHPETQRSWILLFEVAPKEFLDMCHEEAKTMDILPEASACFADGTPAYSAKDIADKLGESEADVIARMEELVAEREALGLPTDGLLTTEAYTKQ